MILEAVSSAVLLTSFMVYYGSMKWIKVKHKEIDTGKLNENGIRVLHISDIHSNKTKKIHINIWKSIEHLDFDMVAITGDFVQSKVEEVIPHVIFLKELVKRAPVYFVEGNHEKRAMEALRRELEQLGVIVLTNQRTKLEIKGNIIDIIGLRDFYVLEEQKFRGLHGLFVNKLATENPKFKIVLSHQPQIIKYIGKYKPEFILSGHTHGGQVRFPFLPALYAPGQGLLPKYDSGLYKEEDSYVYISRGIGATYFNIRFFNRPEIAIINIK